MRAVNLIPTDRRSSSGGLGKSGGAVYVMLSALGGVLLLATLYAVASHQIADRKAQLAKATQDSAAATARATQLAPYKQFSDLRNQREQAIVSLAAGRFDWPSLMHNVASALPPGVTLSTFEGTPAGAGGPAGAAPSAAGGPSAASGPSVHLVGCAGNHTQVGDVINHLRGVPGVANVSFTSSTKSASPGGASSSAGGTCGASRPQFDLTASFSATGSPLPSATPSPSTAAQPAAATAAAPAPATAAGSHR